MDTSKHYICTGLDEVTGSHDKSEMPYDRVITMSETEHDTDFDKYETLDDLYDVVPSKKGGQVNNRMSTLNRQAGINNRNRNNGLI